MMKTCGPLALLFLALPGLALALGSHEVLVLVNDASSNSIEIAAEFVKLRQVPEINVVRLNLPAYAGAAALDISPEDFTRAIWTPALRAVKERGIEDHILAWVYSVDFPTTVRTVPTMSLQGITFLRNIPTTSARVEKGTYASPLFAGPNPIVQGSENYPSSTFDQFAEWLRDDMPLPSMMLGYTGARGNTKETVIRCLRSGSASDGTWPTGTVFFVTSDDVRSTCRQWQFAPVQRDLVRMGIRAEVTRTFPAGRKDIIGIMMGAADVNPGADNRYLPGSMAEHLTSAAGEFQSGAQTKISAWIGAGTAGAAGTVVEPMSAWPKFPSARFFVHYGNGCSMMESFFQSIRCPLQILVLGDPLARPWAPTNVVLRVEGLESGAAGDASREFIVNGMLKLRAEARSELGGRYPRFLYLLDGKIVGRGAELALDTSTIKDGPHTLRVVGYSAGLVRNQVFVEKIVTVRNGRKEAQEKK